MLRCCAADDFNGRDITELCPCTAQKNQPSLIPRKDSQMRTSRAALLILAATLSLPLALHPRMAAPADAGPATVSALVQNESGLAAAINGQREANGLSDLAVDTALTDVARFRSDDQVSRHYFSHVTPDGKTIFDYLNADGIPWSSAGENLAESRGMDPVQAAINGFMQSPEHRDNVLGAGYGRVGVGASQGSDGTTIITVVFTN
jgi:uncharacterized protein YkwD